MDNLGPSEILPIGLRIHSYPTSVGQTGLRRLYNQMHEV